MFRPFQSFHRALSSLFHRRHFPPSFGDAVAIGKGGSCGKCDNRLLFVRSVRVDGDGDHAGVRAFRCESDVEYGEFEHAVGGNGGGISRGPLQLTGFEAAPAVEAGMLGVATMCLVVVERMKGKEKGE